jgi:hypothetical protein
MTTRAHSFPTRPAAAGLIARSGTACPRVTRGKGKEPRQQVSTTAETGSSEMSVVAATRR